jgi:methionyl-tRNA formyltransferase
LRKDEAPLDWSRPAAQLARQVRAFNPWPIAEARLGDRTIRVWMAHAVDGADATNAAAGEIVAAGRSGVDVATGDGVLRLITLQAPGGRPLPAADFLNGHPVSVGDRFA